MVWRERQQITGIMAGVFPLSPACAGCVSHREAFCDQRRISALGNMLIPERREFDWASEESEDGVASDAPQCQGAVLPNLQSAVDVRYPVKRGRRGGRVGDATTAAGRCEGVQEVIADGAPNETGGVEEAKPPCQRKPASF